MGTNLVGDDARIWELHAQGFCVARIAELVGLTDARVRDVITGAWLDDKLEARNARSSRGAPC